MAILSQHLLPLALTVACVSSSVSVTFGQGRSGAGKARTADAYRQFAMAHEGDAWHGKNLFADEQRVACSKCHSIDGKGSKAGPDLFAVGDQCARRDLIDAVLMPSASIAVGYSTTQVETKSGEEYQGVLKQVTDSGIELMGADGQRVRIATGDIQGQRGSSVSLMPEGLQAGLSLQEFTDLIEYLVTLKQPEHALTSYRGMPDTIPQLARPIELRPILSEDLRVPPASTDAGGNVQLGLVWFGQVPGFPERFLAVHQAGMIWLIEKNESGEGIPGNLSRIEPMNQSHVGQAFRPEAGKDAFHRVPNLASGRKVRDGVESVPTRFVKRTSVFVDLTAEVFSARGPNGLLGLAFHPRFRENRKYFMKHQVFEDGKIATVLVERQIAPDFKTDSGQPSRRLLKIVSVAEHHNGGCIEFGPDGFLYLGMGDSAPNFDPQGYGQDLRLLFGKMLRIDVDRCDAGLPYGIPAGNPFAGRPDVRPEIWAYGLREPWRFSFDSVTGDLWVADLGQERGDEIDIVRRGENHGWNVYEGFEIFSNEHRKEGAVYVPPIFSNRRKHGSAVMGGHVYRGDKNSTFYGVYVFGDYQSKRIWGLTQDNRSLKTIRQLASCPQAITAFATDEKGSLYVVGYAGMIYKLDFTGAKFDEPVEAFSAHSAIAPAANESVGNENKR